MSKNKSNMSPKSSQLRSNHRTEPSKPTGRSPKKFEDITYPDNSRFILDEKGIKLIEARQIYKPNKG